MLGINKKHPFHSFVAILFIFLIGLSFSSLPAAAQNDPSLIIYYSFDDGLSGLEGRPDGTVVNGSPMEVPGVQGGGLAFSGQGDYLQVPLTDTLRFDPNLDSFTYSIWAKPIAVHNGDEILCTFQNVPLISIYRSYLDNTGLNVKRSDSAQDFVAGEAVWDSENWHLFTGTWRVDGDTAFGAYYLDGQLVAQQSQPVVSGASYPYQGLYVGATHHCTTSGPSLNYGEFVADEVRVYNRALASNEVETLFQETAPRPNPAALWSVRRANPEYSGPAMRVRRGSDNAEQDIGFLANGDLDETQLLNFVGTSDGFVRTWYSQRNDHHAVQATPASQPRIVSDGSVNEQNDKPALLFDGVDDRFDIPSLTDVARNVGYVSSFSVSGGPVAVSSTRALFDINLETPAIDAPRYSVTRPSAAQNRFRMPGRRLDSDGHHFVDSGTDHNGLLTQISGVMEYQNAVAYIRQNGSLTGFNGEFGTPGNTPDVPSGLVQIGARSNGLFWDGHISEIQLFNEELAPDLIGDAYSQRILDLNPLVYYKLDETSGTVTNDSSGNGLHGTYVGGPVLGKPSLVSGEPSSVEFDGIDAEVVGPYIGTLTFPVTIVQTYRVPQSGSFAWMTHDITAGTRRNYEGIFSFLGGGNVQFIIGDGGGGGPDNRRNFTASHGLSVGDIAHVVFVARSHIDADIYVNGQTVPVTTDGSGTGMFTGNSSKKLRLGMYPDNTGNPDFWAGNPDEIAIFNNTELAAAQIRELYFRSIGQEQGFSIEQDQIGYFSPVGSIPTDGLVAHWDFNEDLNSTTAEEHINGHHGTLTSTALRTSDGKSGNALLADGSNFIDLGTRTNLLGLGNEFTLVAWVFRAEGTSGNEDILRLLDLGWKSNGFVASENVGLRVHTGSVPFFTVIKGQANVSGISNVNVNGEWTAANARIKPGEWNLVFMDRTSTEAHAYVYNSEGVTQDSVTYPESSLIGHWQNRGNYFFKVTNGSPETTAFISPPGHKLDDVFVYNRVITQAERDKIWNESGGVMTNSLEVTQFEPEGYVSEPVNMLSARFTLPLDTGSVTQEDVVVSGPQTVEIESFTFRDDGRTLDIHLISSIETEGSYEVRIGPDIRSTFGNEMEAAFEGQFILDAGAPAAPVVDSHAPLPEVHLLNTRSVTLTGTREAGSAILVNGEQQVELGDSAWSIQISLQEGENNLAITARDAAGNTSEAVLLRFNVDSIAPVINGVVPADGAYLATVPETIALAFTETGSDVDVPNSNLAVTLNNIGFTGDWNIVGNTLIFTPHIQFTEGEYAIAATLRDLAGLSSNALNASFVVDQTPPPAPTVNALPEITTVSPITVSGGKEAGAAILLNGDEIISLTPTTAWSYAVPLAEGNNELALTARDRAGNESVATHVSIVFDNTAPGPVVLTADGEGDGMTAVLNWGGYDEAANGNDIQKYIVYVNAADFTDVSQAAALAETPAGTKNYTAGGLQRGQTYYFAVVAVDTQDNAVSTVTATPVMTVDNVPPENVTNLSAQSFEDQLVISWNASADSGDDLAEYRVDVDGNSNTVGGDVTQYTATGLSPATGYPVTVYAVDGEGNESSGASITGVTLLQNPVIQSTEPLNGMVELSWNAVSPAQYVKQYAIYASTTDFTDTTGMTPRLKVSANTTSTRLAGLTNNTTYYLAVATINTSGGERRTVTTVSETPSPDTEGPELSDMRYSGIAISDGSTLSQPGKITLVANDPVGIGRVEFYIDGQLLVTDANGSSNYSADWNIRNVEDGAHMIAIAAFDTLDNRTDLNLSVTVDLGPPAAPQITQPQSGLTTNKAEVAVAGSTEPGLEVFLYNNGDQVAGPVTANTSGGFSATVPLTEGDNALTAAAQNRGGLSEQSAAVNIALDTSIPNAPTNLSAFNREGGEVRLIWGAATGENIAGYDVYRSMAAFTDRVVAEKINSALIKDTAYTDIPFDDGTYYYSVVALNNLNTVSDLSNQVSIVVDSTPPRALSIEYTPHGNVDPVTGSMAVGMVDVSLTVNEPLLTTPFLTIAPDGGVPITVSLGSESDTVYTGSFEIKNTTPSGTAFAVFSARDVTGNRGTEIDSGRTIEIDAQGPEVHTLTIAPSHPVKTDQANPTTVSVNLDLTEPVKAATSPNLSYLLSGPGRTETAIDNLVQVDADTWRGSFALPADAGLTTPETLHFTFSAPDDLDNLGSRILNGNDFQVYQGELPALNYPFGLQAQALPGGKVSLTWSVVDEASDYQVYRRGPSDAELLAVAFSNGATEYVDQTLEDGTHHYAVASVRRENGQESIGERSPSVQVEAIATPPGAPTNLTLQLFGRGILAEWQPPAGAGDITYRLYRSTELQIFSVDGLTPIIDNIGSVQALDTNPSQAEHAYAVTAVDAAGNESEPSESVYLNFELLPVNPLEIVQVDGDKPQVTWTHASATVVAYDIYLGDNESGLKLNAAPLDSPSFVDVGYNDDPRLYTVVPIDNSNTEGPARGLLLPKLRATLPAEAVIQRGIMNRLEYNVVNAGTENISGVKLRVKAGTHNHVSEPFSIDAGASKTVPVIVGGFADLSDLEQLTTTLDIVPSGGERVQIVRHSQIQVADAGLVLGLAMREFTRGGSGQVQFTLENSSDIEIEIVTALNTGKNPSNEMRFKLLDADENVLSVKAYQRFTGLPDSNVVIITLPNGKTVARIPPGETLVSDWFEVPVPNTAPDQITVQMEVDKLHYRLGTPEAVQIEGLNTRRTTAIVDTAYTAEITNISPQVSFGDQDIVITGRAVDRVSVNPLPLVPVKLVITVNGFERVSEVTSNIEGNFSYTFTPLAGEAGIYKVSAIHPDILDRPESGQFIISRVTATPTKFTVRIPRNFEQHIPIRLTAAQGTTATNVHIEFNPADQPTGSLPAGITLDTGETLNLTSGQHATINLTMSADDTADAVGNLVLVLKSDESGASNLVRFDVHYELSAAEPALFVSPNFVETGVTQGGSANEKVTLENRGLANLKNVRVELLSVDGFTPPNWIYLSSQNQQGDVAVGEKREIGLAVNPGTGVLDDVYQFILRVTSDNADTHDVGVFVSVTQSGIGNALFKLSDIYTATVGDDGNLIEGLAGARIRVQNEQVFSVEETLFTDSAGEAFFNELPAGSYIFRASANNHEDKTGRFRIKPGITVAEEVFLDYNLVTVNWSVREITIQDRYEITLSATFEANVPAAVVVADPLSTQLPEMQPGDVFYGEIVLTNHGLIRADNFNFTMPASDQYFKFEMMQGIPDSIEAKAKISIPYRVVSLQSLNPDGTATGGGCAGYHTRSRYNYSYACANGTNTQGGGATSWFTPGSGSCSGGGGGGGGAIFGGGGGAGGGGGGGSAPTFSENISGLPACRPTGDNSCPATGNGVN